MEKSHSSMFQHCDTVGKESKSGNFAALLYEHLTYQVSRSCEPDSSSLAKLLPNAMVFKSLLSVASGFVFFFLFLLKEPQRRGGARSLGL